jgi:anti-sigma factor RsiW
MKQCLSPDLWTGFLDGALPPLLESEAEAHLAECRHCRFLASEFVRVEAVLAGAANESKQGAALAPAEIRIALDRFHAQIRRPQGIACRLEALRFFLDAMLGSSAGNKVLRVAALQEEIDEPGWAEFIGRLAAMIGDLCGDGAGTIVSYIGKLAEPEMA